MIKEIKSKQNNLAKKVKQLSSKKYRDSYDSLVVEGTKLVEEVINASLEIEAIIMTEF